MDIMENFEEMSSDLRKMVESSVTVREKAYAPFSNFKVGAALLCDDGTVFGGCNVENSSYSLGICAERSAIVKAVSEGRQKFIAVAVCAVYQNDFVYPCGACRQTLVEFSDPENFNVYSVIPDKLSQINKITLAQLLPNWFKLHVNESCS